MRAVIFSAVSALMVLAPLVSSVAAAQPTTPCAAGCLSRVQSGDSNPSFGVSAAAYQSRANDYGFDNACEWLGEEECFANEPGGTDASTINGSSHRMVNAILLAEEIPFFGGPHTWEDKINGDVAWVEPHPESHPYMQAWGAIGNCHIDVSRRAMRRDTVWRRAAAFIHENRHCDINDIHGGECPAGPAGCDAAWEDEGAYQWTVLFLTQFAEDAGPTWNALQRGDAIANANEFINLNFEQHPGFQYYLTVSGQARRWTFEDTEVGVHPPFPSDGRRGIQRLEVHLTVEQVGSNYSPVVSGVRATYRRIGLNGALGVATVEQSGQLTSDPSSIVVMDASTFGDDRLLTSFGLTWVPTAGYPISIEGQVRGFATARLVHFDGTLSAAATLYVNDGEGPVGQWQACTPGDCAPGLFCDGTCQFVGALDGLETFSAGEGELLTGVAFEVASGDEAFGAITIDSALPPIYAMRAGSPLGQSDVAACPTSHSAIGVMAASNSTASNAPFVGPFGLLCAPTLDLMQGQGSSLSDLVISHASFERADGALVQAGQVSGLPMFELLASLDSQSLDLIRCPDGDALAGLTGHALVAVDEVDGLYCRPFGATDLEPLAGSVGGVGGEAFVQFCPPGYSVRGFQRHRMGTWLTSVALRCVVEPT